MFINRGKFDVELFNSELRSCREHTRDWRNEAYQARELYSGRQYDSEDLDRQDNDFHPVYNLIRPSVDAISGVYRTQRQRLSFIPRRIGQAHSSNADQMDAAVEYIYGDADIALKISSAFQSMLITGMGWTETWISEEENPDGDVKFSVIDPLTMYWDPSSTEHGLGDSRWRAREVRISRYEAAERWGEAVADSLLANSMFSRAGYRDEPSPQDAYYPYGVGTGDPDPRPGDTVYVWSVQWFEVESRYRIETGDGPVLVRKDALIEGLNYDGPYNTRVYKSCHVGAGKVIDGPEDLISRSGFTLNCMTGHYDDNKESWYGVVRYMNDPQRLTNVILKNYIAALASAAKGGGLIIEQGALSADFMTDIEEDWSRPVGIHVVRSGAISGNQIMPRPVQPVNQSISDFHATNLDMFRQVTGINTEMVGATERTQPGILEYQRKQAAITSLAWAFDSVALYLKQWGRMITSVIQEVFSDGRLIRITGSGVEGYVPLSRSMLAAEYDISVDTAPTSPNEQERVMSMLMTALPSLIQAGITIPPEILEYLPLPSPLRRSWSKAIQDQSRRGPDPVQQAAAQAQIQWTQADAQAKLGSVQIKGQELQLKAQELLLEQQKLQLEAQRVKIEKASAIVKGEVSLQDAQTKRSAAQSKSEIDFAELARQMREDQFNSQQALKNSMREDVVAAMKALATRQDEEIKAAVSKKSGKKGPIKIERDENGFAIKIGGHRIKRNDMGNIDSLEEDSEDE